MIKNKITFNTDTEYEAAQKEVNEHFKILPPFKYEEWMHITRLLDGMMRYRRDVLNMPVPHRNWDATNEQNNYR